MPTYGFDETVDQVAMAKLARFGGADYDIDGPGDWLVSAVAGQARTIMVAAGTGYGCFILDELIPAKTIQLDPITSGKRWDLIARRRTWSSSGGGTSDFVNVTGVAAADPTAVIPIARRRGPGTTNGDDQPLALVQLAAGLDLPQQIIDLRPRPTKIITVTTLLALPDAGLGAWARVAGVDYHREYDSAGNLQWVAPNVSTQTVTKDVSAPQAGFVIDSGFVNRCVVDNTGKDVTYEVEFRRSGAALSFGTSGALSDIFIAKLTGPAPDANLGYFSVPVTFRAQGGSSTSQTSGVHCHGYLTPDGNLYLESGIPSGFIAQQAKAGADVWSLQATIRFRKA